MASSIDEHHQRELADGVTPLSGERRFSVRPDGAVAEWDRRLHGRGAPATAAELFAPAHRQAFLHGLAAAARGATVLLELAVESGGIAPLPVHCRLGAADRQGHVPVELHPVLGQPGGGRDREAEALTVLARVVADLAGHGGPGRLPEAAAARALEQLARLLDADRVVLLPARAGASGILAGWPATDALEPLPARLVSSWLPRLRLDQLVHIPDVRAITAVAAADAEALAARGTRSLLAVPVHDATGLDAFVLVESAEPRRWGPWVATLLRIVAGMVHADLARRREVRLRAGDAERLEVVMRHAGSVLLLVDDDAAVRFVSSSLTRVLGWAPEQWTGRSLLHLVHPRDREAMERALEPAFDGSAGTVEVRVPDEHARWRWMSVALGGRLASGDSGRVIHLHDVTDRVRLEAEERRLLETIAATPDFIATFSPHGVIVSINPAGLAMTGLFEGEAVGLPITSLFPEWARRVFTGEAIPVACETGVWSGDSAIMRADGQQVPVSQVVLAHRDPSGEVAFLSTMMRDVSEQRAAEQLLRRHTVQLLTVAELGQRALRQRDGADLVREVLLAAGAMFDADHALFLEAPQDSRAEVRLHDGDGAVRALHLPAPLDDLLDAPQPVVLPRVPDAGAPEALAGLVPAGGGLAFAVVRGAQRPRGLLAVLTAEPGTLAPDDGHALDSLAGLLSTAFDRLEGEARLRQAERLEAVGRLAGGIAHDFNNLLTVVLVNAERLGSDAAPAAEEITRAGTSAARLVEQLLTFSRGKPATAEVADLRRLVEEFEPLLRRVIREDIELTVRLCAQGCPVAAGVPELEQILMNLVVNARDAIPGTGQIEVSLECDAEAGMALLRVRDNGEGIDPAIAGRIFEPYISTKRTDGSGLGLATVHSITVTAGGRVLVESVPGAGTTFTVELPLQERRREPRPRPAPPRALPLAGSARVLVVEDQAAIRSLVVESLRREGLDVIEAPNGAAAERLAEEQEHIDLVVTDVVMPEQNGPAMMQALRLRWPALPVVYMSGYSGDEVPQDDERAGFLQKPFSLSDVREAVWRFLGDPR